MVARITTAAFQGMDVLPIDVQVQISSGLPAFHMVGLPDKAVAESRERVRAALQAMGMALPAKRITVNLAPADVLKEGSHYDLPIALALLAALNILPIEEIANFMAMGELSLDGQITKVAGILPAAFKAAELGRGFICPEYCGREAAWVEGIDILPAPHLLAVIQHFQGKILIHPPQAGQVEEAQNLPDLADIKGQEAAKRMLEIAAVGGHHLLFSGPPGSGKSMLAARLTSLLPPLTPEEALEISMIYSMGGLLEEGQILRHRPFRDPHHSASQAAMVGGGSKAKPGEISLAHTGVLFLDELPEFPRACLEALRQSLETRKVTVARANHHVQYPARFQMVAAMNPCRCGYLDDPGMACARAPKCAVDYQAKISGPILDRIDLQMDVERVAYADLAITGAKETSRDVAARVAKAREFQRARREQYNLPSWAVNSTLEGAVLEEVAAPEAAGKKLLLEAGEKMRLSARGYHRVLKLARTLADMEEEQQIRAHHVAEALNYRRVRSTG
ncbi:MAG: YifB family Mg chelatase-like AAA ATPase [Alphaproteobacteria bacterium]